MKIISPLLRRVYTKASPQDELKLAAQLFAEECLQRSKTVGFLQPDTLWCSLMLPSREWDVRVSSINFPNTTLSTESTEEMDSVPLYEEFLPLESINFLQGYTMNAMLSPWLQICESNLASDIQTQTLTLF